MDPAGSVRRHISECDRMYESVYGKPDECPETSVCKRLMDSGVMLTQKDMPRICIRECERWNLRTYGW